MRFPSKQEQAARRAEEAAAENWATPRQELLYLARHSRGVVAHVAAKHTALTRADMEALWSEDSDVLRMGILRNPNVPQHLVDKAASDPYEAVRIAAALCPVTTEESLWKLRSDASEAVRHHAARRLEGAS